MIEGLQDLLAKLFKAAARGAEQYFTEIGVGNLIQIDLRRTPTQIFLPRTRLLQFFGGRMLDGRQRPGGSRNLLSGFVSDQLDHQLYALQVLADGCGQLLSAGQRISVPRAWANNATASPDCIGQLVPIISQLWRWLG